MGSNNPMSMIMQMMRGGNPMQMLQQMAQNNPQAAQAMNMIQGKNPQQIQQIARNMAKERGVNIEDMMRQFGMGNYK